MLALVTQDSDMSEATTILEGAKLAIVDKGWKNVIMEFDPDIVIIRSRGRTQRR